MLQLLFALCAVIVCVTAGPLSWTSLTASRSVRTNRTLTMSYRPYDVSWEHYKVDHEKSYSTVEEEMKRYRIFLQNVQVIEQHNKLYEAGHKSYFLGLNQFADWEFAEFSQYNGYSMKYKLENDTELGVTYLSPSNVMLPSEVDWRKEGYVTPVKNQGECGSCWSFSTTGALEGQHFKKSGKLISLSEQQLVDCSKRFGNNGCNGGLMDNAFKYIKAVGGEETEEEYPYTAKDTARCHFKKKDVVATDSGFVDIPEGDEAKLQEALATVGSISIAIDASHQSFQLYKGGVYDEPECSSTQLDHGVLTVGYGTLDGSDYWLVKNSWSAKWGEDGYINMARNKDNQCGVATQASYPLV